MTIKTGIGQDSHAFEIKPGKPLILAGVNFDHSLGLKGNSDADVIFHSITNAISSVTGKNILGSVADELSQQGVKDSSKYLQIALNDLPCRLSSKIFSNVRCSVGFSISLPFS